MSEIRKFETGATRDSAAGKFDYEGFLSPLVIERFGAYMDLHRKQADGQLRDSDNWQRGMSLDVYIKSGWRHFFAWWKIHRKGTVRDERDNHIVTVDEAMCGLLFNLQGYLHEYLKQQAASQPTEPPEPGNGSPVCTPRHTPEQLDALVESVRNNP